MNETEINNLSGMDSLIVAHAPTLPMAIARAFLMSTMRLTYLPHAV